MLEEVVFEEGNRVRRIKGEVIEETELFLRLQTLTRVIKIYHRAVIKREENPPKRPE